MTLKSAEQIELVIRYPKLISLSTRLFSIRLINNKKSCLYRTLSIDTANKQDTRQQSSLECEWICLEWNTARICTVYAIRVLYIDQPYEVLSSYQQIYKLNIRSKRFVMFHVQLQPLYVIIYINKSNCLQRAHNTGYHRFFSANRWKQKKWAKNIDPDSRMMEKNQSRALIFFNWYQFDCVWLFCFRHFRCICACISENRRNGRVKYNVRLSILFFRWKINEQTNRHTCLSNVVIISTFPIKPISKSMALLNSLGNF